MVKEEKEEDDDDDESFIEKVNNTGDDIKSWGKRFVIRDYKISKIDIQLVELVLLKDIFYLNSSARNYNKISI